MFTIAAIERICLSVILLVSTPLHAAPDLTPQIAALLREQGLDGAVWTTLDVQGAAGVSDARSGQPMPASRQAVRRVDFFLDAPVDVMVDGEVLRLQCQHLEILPAALQVLA